MFKNPHDEMNTLFKTAWNSSVNKGVLPVSFIENLLDLDLCFF